MNISSFFQDLRSAYQAEMDDLATDSEGNDVLRKRLAERRQELGFLLSMLQTAPEMVAVVFHQGFSFKLPAVLDHLLTQEADEFPDWNSLADAVQLSPWAQDLSKLILKEPMGDWFMTVAAALDYMHHKHDAKLHKQDLDAHEDEHGHDDHDDHSKVKHSDEEGSDARTREEAHADWLEQQGFDRKD
ncbi:MAG: hypothetical protein WB821_16240 [Burkholderiaceae bacterium]